jgi:hypothetical protein
VAAIVGVALALLSDHAEMWKYLQPASDRFKAIEDPEDQKSFRDKLISVTESRRVI